MIATRCRFALRRSGSRAQGHATLAVLACLAVATAYLSPVSLARAEVLSIPAIAFSLRCPCGNDVGDQSEFVDGVLKTVEPGSRFYAPISFPRNGHKVCAFTLVYHDVNNNDAMTASLVKKGFATGKPAFNPPTIMATVATAPGVRDVVRKVTTRAISSRTISKGNAFYYALIEAPTVNLNILGVLIDVRPSCPPS